MIFLCLLTSQETCYKSNQALNVYTVFHSLSFNISNIARGSQTLFSSKGFQDHYYSYYKLASKVENAFAVLLFNVLFIKGIWQRP